MSNIPDYTCEDFVPVGRVQFAGKARKLAEQVVVVVEAEVLVGLAFAHVGVDEAARKRLVHVHLRDPIEGLLSLSVHARNV